MQIHIHSTAISQTNAYICTYEYFFPDIVIGFEESVHFVNEGDGTVTVFVVVRDGEPSGDVIVEVSTANGTALCE